MSKPAQQPNPTWPMWPFNLDVLPNPFATAAPAEVDQSINPGRTFGNLINVTEQNSSAPDTERDIVAAESYGRQLGHIIDALAVLIAERPDTAPRVAALDELTKLRDHIDAIKSAAATRRLDRIADDLATLKRSDPDAYRRIADTLRSASGAED